MRTTVTLDADVAAALERIQHERRVSFKRALNDAVRAGLRAGTSGPAVRTPVFDLGVPTIDVTKALAAAAELDDATTVAELERGA